jgi:hypothetical protein
MISNARNGLVNLPRPLGIPNENKKEKKKEIIIGSRLNFCFAKQPDFAGVILFGWSAGRGMRRSGAGGGLAGCDARCGSDGRLQLQSRKLANHFRSSAGFGRSDRWSSCRLRSSFA